MRKNAHAATHDRLKGSFVRIAELRHLNSSNKPDRKRQMTGLSPDLHVVREVAPPVFAWDIECMDPRSLHPDVQEFVSSLQKLEAILLKYEQGFWAEKLSRVRQTAENSDGYCVQLFLGLFGGMGSFNDLVLEAPASANNELAIERARAYELAQALR